MSVKVDGLKHLDDNNYDRIIIRQINDSFIVNVRQQDKNIYTISPQHKLSSELKKEEDIKKIGIIIEEFSNNIRINAIYERKRLDYYDGTFCGAKGSKELDFQIFDSSIKDTLAMVRNKYRNDRLKFWEENKDINNYEITGNSFGSTYEKIEGNTGSILKFSFLSQYDRVFDFEKEFLEELLYSKLYSVGEEAKIVGKRGYFPFAETYIDLGNFVECGDFSMRLPMTLTLDRIVRNVVINYNYSLEKVKEKQLKMEGF